jgi:LacI family transcriptional regulator
VPPTMRDVAQKAQVSIKTVSRVVNDQGEVSDETRQRVLAAIKQLGYRPSKVARALVTQRTDTLGLILGDITNPFFSEFSHSVLNVAQAKGYDVFLCNSAARVHQEIRALHSLADHNVDGIIIFPSWRNEEHLQDFAARDRPVVVMMRPFQPHVGIGQVLADTARGAQLAVNCLVGKGHTRIAMLAGYRALPNVFSRVRGFRDALEAHGIPVRDEWIVAGIPIVEHGHRLTRRLLTKYPEITAIFAYNDLLAVGALQACKELGRRVPDDCAVVGFDDIQLASLVSPALTTVRLDKVELGRRAVEQLLQMLDSPRTVFPPVYVDLDLAARESA